MELVTMILACSLYPDNAIPNAMVEVATKNKPLTVTTVYSDGNSQTKNSFKSAREAAQYARQQISNGNSVELGVMGIPNSWLSKLGNRGVTLEQLLHPCKNIVVGTDILNQATIECAGNQNEQACILSVFKTGDSHQALDYANQVLDYAKSHPITVAKSDMMPKSQQYDPSVELPLPTFNEPSSLD